jgi:hypothetical protein
VLVLIGLIYELVIRLDGLRLGSGLAWMLSSAGGGGRDGRSVLGVLPALS